MILLENIPAIWSSARLVVAQRLLEVRDLEGLVRITPSGSSLGIARSRAWSGTGQVADERWKRGDVGRA